MAHQDEIRNNNMLEEEEEEEEEKNKKRRRRERIITIENTGGGMMYISSMSIIRYQHDLILTILLSNLNYQQSSSILYMSS